MHKINTKKLTGHWDKLNLVKANSEMSNNVTFSKIRRLGLEKQRFRSNSQDMLNENSIQGMSE